MAGSVRWISGLNGRGTGSGTSYANAAPWSDLNHQLQNVGAGGQCRVDASWGPYPTLGQTINASPGSPTAYAVLRGSMPDGQPASFKMYSSRADPYYSNAGTNGAVGGANGSAGLTLSSGLANLEIAYIDFVDMGLPCIGTKGTSTIQNISLHNLTGTNIRRFIAATDNAGFVNFDFHDLAIKGASKACIKLEGDNSGGKIHRFTIDGDRQAGDAFATGIALTGGSSGSGGLLAPQTFSDFVFTLGSATATSASANFYDSDWHRTLVTPDLYTLPNGTPGVTDGTPATIVPAGTTISTVVNATTVVLSAPARLSQSGVNGIVGRNSTDRNHDIEIYDFEVKNMYDELYLSTGMPNNGTYWNADGIATEEVDDAVYIHDGYIHNCHDGGVDFKSTNTVVENVTVEEVKHGFRVWSSGDKLINCTSINPRMGEDGGGSGSSSHVQSVAGGSQWIGGLMHSDTLNGAGGIEANNANHPEITRLPFEVYGATCEAPSGFVWGYHDTSPAPIFDPTCIFKVLS